jgi:5,6,7,8-tetrahydromethanopterin hydro-lyase
VSESAPPDPTSSPSDPSTSSSTSSAAPRSAAELIPTLIGEGFEGSGSSAAHVKAVLGDRKGPVGAAWITALATPSAGHSAFLVVARPGLAVRPHTLFVPTATTTEPEHSRVTWGGAQAGVATGVLDALSTHLIPFEIADGAVLIASVWVDPAATTAHQDAVFVNNRVAMLAALRSAVSGRPTAEEVLNDDEGIWNPFFSPT